MRIRSFALLVVALLFGALAGTILAPQPAGAVNKDMIDLEQNVQTLLQGQQDLRSAMDQNSASMKTLIQQSMDTVNQMNSQMASLQKTVQQVQANSGSRMDSLTQQQQGISDNLSDVQSRVQKLSQQLTDIQSTLQSIDAKVSSSAPAPSPDVQPAPGSYPPSNSTAPGVPTGDATPPSTYGAPSGAPNSYNASPYSNPASATAGGGMAPTSAETLYRDAQRDYQTGNYDLSRQEFSDYIKRFPTSAVAPDSQFYLGEIYFAQGDYKDAIPQYDLVLTKYPESLKLSSALLKKAQAEISLRERTSGIRDLREVESKFPGSDDSRRAKSILQSMGVSSTVPHSSTAR